jgi:hypothetical protein
MQRLKSILLILFFLLTTNLVHSEQNSDFRIVPGESIENTNSKLAYLADAFDKAEKYNFYVINQTNPNRNHLYLNVPYFAYDVIHPAELHHRNLYLRIKKKTKENYIGELWKYDAQKKGIRILGGSVSFYADFRVSDDEKYIAALVGDPSHQVYGDQINLFDAKGGLLLALGPNDLGVQNSSLSHLRWHTEIAMRPPKT